MRYPQYFSQWQNATSPGPAMQPMPEEGYAGQTQNLAQNAGNWQALAGGVSGIGAGLLSALFGSGQNPSQAAMPYYNQISGVNQQYLGPYAQMGQGIAPSYMNQITGLMQNPSQVMNQIGANYHASPGFAFKMQQALLGANNAAAAGGKLGSPANTQQNMSLAESLANQDYYNYMNQATNLYGQGLQGAQNIYGTGAESANNLAGNISQAMAMQALAAYLGQANQNQNQNSMFGNIMGGVGDLAGYYFGGPAGAAMGGAAGQGIGNLFGS